jgi:hypothetical protein
MDPVPGRAEGPTAELLLDVRTPAELVWSPDGSTIAFALHATVADIGSFVPSDLFVVGSRLAFLSDRITPGPGALPGNVRAPVHDTDAHHPG